MFSSVRGWEFSSQFSQVEGAKDEIVCWDLYSLEVLTKLDLTTALPGAFQDPVPSFGSGKETWKELNTAEHDHPFYHGFIMDLPWIYLDYYTETLGWN